MSTLKVNNLTDLGADAVVTDGVIAASALPAGSILQVVSTTKTDTFSTSQAGGAVAAITGLSASITPGSTSSKILILGSVNSSSDSGSTQLGGVHILYRDATEIGSGDAAGGRLTAHNGSGALWNDTNILGSSSAITFLDSPATTSSITYSVSVGNPTGSTRTTYVNRTSGDSDSTGRPRITSTITLIEVAG